MKKILILFAILFSMFATISAQRVAVSTDLLKWGMLSPNINMDIVVSRKSTINFEASFNPYNYTYNKNICMRHVMITPEYRYWFKNALFSHHIGVHCNFTYFDFRFGDKMYNGQTFAVGISYGYAIVLSDHWNLHPIIGIGAGYVNRTLSPDQVESSPVKNGFMPMITKLGFSLTYVIN